MTGEDALVWRDADGHFTVHRDIAPDLAATVLALQARQARLDGGGLLRPGVGAACRQIGELSKGRIQRISAEGNSGMQIARIETWLTTSEAAVLFGKTPRRINQLCASGSIDSKRVGPYRLVDRTSAHEYFNRRGRNRGGREG